MSTITKSDRIKFGITGKAQVCTRVFRKPLDGFENVEAHSFLFVDDNKGTIVQGNVYNKGTGEYLGRNYDATKYTKVGLDAAKIEKATKGFTQVVKHDLAEVVPLKGE